MQNFLVFGPPPPSPCPRLGLIYITKSTQPPLLRHVLEFKFKGDGIHRLEGHLLVFLLLLVAALARREAAVGVPRGTRGVRGGAVLQKREETSQPFYSVK